ncbi:unnamed protein product [Mytilus coruscus]|uniref:Endonuclease/exonuclease/phosphatase domain-containing protein n=1 Tax=Mytilus coruscus TaxID=42192 RepID=A0A6J8BC58_MYTCO|nr:unnamed protein product [Mytilus coruscus]
MSLCSIIQEICFKYNNSTIWIGVDLNLPDINWSSNTITGNQYRKDINDTFLSLENDLGLIQSVHFPTRGPNILDLFLTNRPSLINRCEPVPGISDHEIVFIDSSIAVMRQKPIKRIIQMWKKAYIISLKDDAKLLASEFTNKFNVQSDINTLWNNFKDNCLTIIDKNVPSKSTPTRISQPWITKELHGCLDENKSSTIGPRSRVKQRIGKSTRTSKNYTRENVERHITITLTT